MGKSDQSEDPREAMIRLLEEVAHVRKQVNSSVSYHSGAEKRLLERYKLLRASLTDKKIDQFALRKRNSSAITKISGHLKAVQTMRRRMIAVWDEVECSIDKHEDMADLYRRCPELVVSIDVVIVEYKNLLLKAEEFHKLSE